MICQILIFYTKVCVFGMKPSAQIELPFAPALYNRAMTRLSVSFVLSRNTSKLPIHKKTKRIGIGKQYA